MKLKSTLAACGCITALLFHPVVSSEQDSIPVKPVTLRGVPYSLLVVNNPTKIAVAGDTAVTITAPGRTNLFNAPDSGYYVQNAPRLCFKPDNAFLLTARVSARLTEIYDVAALVIYQDKDKWAKLCFENSALKQTTIVSVVTANRYSDDCNSIKPDKDHIYFAIARKGAEFSFFCSPDYKSWELVRHFRLEGLNDQMTIGFAVHGSRRAKTDSFSGTFSEVTYSAKAPANMRDIGTR
ncbi:DUF1349 domain-containing protein [Filimonas effusa]|uniref:DUF1349 domain-containing protein n=1 Tax=Filimonas effusa TaxID=2508721 RepID=A0A4Q1DBZ5_9BACT|nr:DUF1349 domain-containing protein [Filimonas effusa]RXK86325.1 DUF1349 domain-containing protein [Filimonas effusa]